MTNPYTLPLLSFGPNQLSKMPHFELLGPMISDPPHEKKNRMNHSRTKLWQYIWQGSRSWFEIVFFQVWVLQLHQKSTVGEHTASRNEEFASNSKKFGCRTALNQPLLAAAMAFIVDFSLDISKTHLLEGPGTALKETIGTNTNWKVGGVHASQVLVDWCTHLMFDNGCLIEVLQNC